MLSDSVFGSCPRHALAAFADVREFRFYPAGIEIFSEGEAATEAYCICTGGVTIRKRDEFGIEYDVARIRAGELIGYRNPKEHGVHHVSAVAHTDVTLCVIPIEAIDELARRNPSILFRLVQSYCRRIDELEKLTA
jgi:CRP-like cAMP-binding protein